jgi:hypothetical protein
VTVRRTTTGPTGGFALPHRPGVETRRSIRRGEIGLFMAIGAGLAVWLLTGVAVCVALLG